MLSIMCKMGKACSCAQQSSSFDSSLNVIGASFGLAGIDELRSSRSAELREFKSMVQADQVDRLSVVGSRRSLIQISQCPGIGKTTLLGLMARLYPEYLAETSAPKPKIIGSLVTFNGNVMSSRLEGITVEAALCIRVMYGALVCHSADAGRQCSNLLPFATIANSAEAAYQMRIINVINTRQALWNWFGPHPIFVGIDEALKCNDGTENEKLKHLLTASGMFLDTDRDKPSCCVVLSALSPNTLLQASIESNRAIENILVFPVDHNAGVQMLRSRLSTLKFSAHDDILDQFEALTVGHPRAIERVGSFLLRKMPHEDPSVLNSWENARGKLYIQLVRYLADGTSSALAACPEPDLVEYLISNPPIRYQRSKNNLLGKVDDDFIFAGQVLVTKCISDIHNCGVVVIFSCFGY
jgi:hypothetical protein